MNHTQNVKDTVVADVMNADGAADLVLVCEHASPFIPPQFNDLGLAPEGRQSHVAWDPGAAAVAQTMARRLDAPLVYSCVSRLVYDCNRPPDAPDAMPEKSEKFEVPGNRGLTPSARAARTETYYHPFRSLLARLLAGKKTAALVTVHSFTPVYLGVPRPVEIGVLHDSDSRLADAMLGTAADHGGHDVRRNAPYGPEHGVTHTLREHALPDGRLNVMLEIRNDLIASRSAQEDMGAYLSDWVAKALEQSGSAACSR